MTYTLTPEAMPLLTDERFAKLADLYETLQQHARTDYTFSEIIADARWHRAELAEARAKINRLRHELEILASRAWNLLHGVEQALAVLKPDAGKDTP